MFKQKQSEFIDTFSGLDVGSLFVHSDVVKTMPLVKISRSKESVLSGHIELLHKIVPSRKLLIPTYSYQFPKTRVFDLENTSSEIGYLSEFYRNNFASWRSNDPMFPVSGSGHSLSIETEMQCPFGDESIFANLVDNNGYVLFYGTGFSCATIIHYAEFKSGVGYRYWKDFEGIRVQRDITKKVTLKSHFRPMGMHLDYDWDRLLSDLFEAKIINQHFASVIGCYAKQLVDFWVEKLKSDPLYLLDNESRAWVEPMLDKLGRGFIKSDFEEDLK